MSTTYADVSQVFSVEVLRQFCQPKYFVFLTISESFRPDSSLQQVICSSADLSLYLVYSYTQAHCSNWPFWRENPSFIVRFNVVLIVHCRQYGRLPGCDVTSENTLYQMCQSTLLDSEQSTWRINRTIVQERGYKLSCWHSMNLTALNDHMGEYRFINTYRSMYTNISRSIYIQVLNEWDSSPKDYNHF